MGVKFLSDLEGSLGGVSPVLWVGLPPYLDGPWGVIVVRARLR